MDTIIVIGVGLTTIGFAMAVLVMCAAKRPTRHAAATGDSSWTWYASGVDDGGGGNDCDSGSNDGGSCDGDGGSGGGD
jgi:hypothetical protein